MDYEKAYKESFEAAKGLHEAGNALTKQQMEIVFPQLAESEDERNWKKVEEAIRGFLTNPIDADELLAWLEKQKEPHFTKRNALFDKCVENCDPEIMKKVSDEVDAMLEKEQKPDEPVTDCHDLEEAAEKFARFYDNGTCDGIAQDCFKAGAEWQKRKQPKVKGYGVMRIMEDPHPDDWYMDERGKEHCWGYKFNEPCPWPAEVYIMEAKEDADD